MDSSNVLLKCASGDWNLSKRSAFLISRLRIIVTIFMKLFFYFFICPWLISVITGNGVRGNVIRYHILNGLGKLPLFIYAYICKTIVQRKLTYWLKMPDFKFKGGEKRILRLNFTNVMWWWQLELREKWNPDSITKFGWVEKIKSIHK